MYVRRRIVPLLIAAAVVIAGVAGAAIQQRVGPGIRYFPETGHLVREPFLSFFTQHGEIATFGFPLTDTYTNSDGTLVQTFQRAQLQLTVRGVTLAPIGTALRLGEPGNHTVAAEFKAIYESHGGDSFFGPPLNAVREENGVLVQDFERARLVSGQAGGIEFANLGSIYLSAFPPPLSVGQASIRLRGTPTPPPAIRPNLSLGYPSVAQGAEQVIYLFLEDEHGQPIEGAKALAILRYDRATAEVEMPATNATGVSSTRFIVPPASPGSQVTVEMHVLIGETFLTIETTYFQWW